MYSKIITLIILVFFLVTTSFSQTDFGIKTALNLCKVKYANSVIDNVMKPLKKVKPDIAAGLFVSTELNKILTVDAEVLYTRKGLKYYQLGFSQGVNSMNYIEVPVSGGYNVFLNRKTILNVYIGGYYAFWLNGKYKSTDLRTLETYITKVDFKNPDWEYNRHDAGLLFGMRLKNTKGKAYVDLRYTHSMLTSSSTVADGIYNRLITISLNFRL